MKKTQKRKELEKAVRELTGEEGTWWEVGAWTIGICLIGYLLAHLVSSIL